MQIGQQPHPHAQRLSDFALGKLEPAEIDAVENHLAECPSCCQTIQQIQEDTFSDLVRSGHKVADAERMKSSEALTVAPGGTGEEAPDSPRADSATAHHPSVSALDVREVPPELANNPRYRIMELLGSGGMGAVYKAEHRKMQRLVALKVINPQLVSSKATVERFQREVQAAARLHHPNIVTAYDADQAGDLHFLVMEFVHGTDLHKVVEERGPLPVAEACAYVRQAALGLQHAHENGMVHRDIKPQNLMVSVVRGPSSVAKEETGVAPRTTDHGPQTIKILDFGLASLTSEAALAVETPANPQVAAGGPQSGLTQAGALMGTPDYMAPEQARDAHKADIRADIYSLGCTLYCLLTGHVPYPGGTAFDKVIAHSTSKPKPVGEHRKGLPPALAKILDKMLAKDPTARYQTPAEVADALAPLTTADVRVKPVTAAPADAVLTVALVTLVTGIAIGLAVPFTGLGLRIHPAAEQILQIMAGFHFLYALFMLPAGLLLRRQLGRMAVITLLALFGVFVPVVLAAQMAMQWHTLPQWPALLPQWLGVPVCAWALVVLFRSQARDAFAESARRAPFGWRGWVGSLSGAAGVLLLGGIIYLTTDNGRVLIVTKVDDVQVVFSKGGNEYDVIDLKTGSRVKRLPSGTYQVTLRGNTTGVEFDKRDGFTMTRSGQVTVKVSRAADYAALPRKFSPPEPTITQNDITVDQGGWRIEAKEARTVRLFEMSDPGIEDGILTYRAKMKSEKVQGKAYLEMWCRLPGEGESFSKGLLSPVQGTTDWASYETHFFLKRGQKPDLLKLNVVLEGKGTLWIKDVEVHFKPNAAPEKIGTPPPGQGVKADEERLQGTWRALAGEYAGRTMSADELKATRATFQGEKLTLTLAFAKEALRVGGPFILDPRQEPRRMMYIVQDVEASKGAAVKPNTALHGIYRFDGARLIWCFTEGADRRPTEFATSPKTPDQFLLTLERR